MSAFIVLFIAICLFGIHQRSGVTPTRGGRAQSRWVSICLNRISRYTRPISRCTSVSVRRQARGLEPAHASHRRL